MRKILTLYSVTALKNGKERKRPKIHIEFKEVCYVFT